ncbi:MAG: sialidase family protein [Terriglobales bacterium]|jgi:hypothetical protein
MKRSIEHLTIGSVLFLASFATQGLAQSTPTQVQGTTPQGVHWQALTNQVSVAVAASATTEYVAWKSNTSQEILFSASPNGIAWSYPQVVGGTHGRSTWKAESASAPALAVDKNTGYLWLVWNKNASGDIYYSTYNGTAWTYLQKVTGAQTSIYGIPSVGGGNGITVVWNATDAYYSNWNDPGWSTPQTVGGSGWTAQPGWTLSLTNALPGAGLYWSVAGADVTAQVYGAAYLAVGWVGPVEIGEGCGWTATEPSFLNTPAAADFDNGENSALFWVGTNGLVNYTYETFEGCEYADPANVSGTGLLNGSPTVAIGPTLSILAWTQYRASHSTTSTVWYMNPLTLPGLD